ncbi:MAG TPA: zinc-binding dehydrogenase, partial [Thermoanaerobaculia bacterium]|nr:zinc-binding dehydrogenase [Thermoanaerobaculia bacterium]
PDPLRRRLALEHGFDAVVDPSAEHLPGAVHAVSPRGADAVFVVPTSPAAALPAVEAAAPAGRVVFFSPVAPGETWPIAPNVPYFKDLTLRFSYSSGPLETRRALDLIASGALPVERLVTHRLPLERTAEAFALAESGGATLKVVVEI